MLDCQDDTIAGIRAARRQFADLAAGWRAVSARSAAGAKSEAEVMVFNQMVVALAGLLPELPPVKDDRHAPAMVEARILAKGVLTGGVVPADAALPRDVSLTGFGPGDRIAMTEEAFTRLAGVCLDGMARRAARA